MGGATAAQARGVMLTTNGTFGCLRHMGEGERVVGYVRVSTDGQGAHGAGLGAQRDSIENEASRRGWIVLRIEEDVLSGRHMRRPGLRRALAAVESGEAAGLVVAKLDRLSRSLIDFASLLARAKREGWNLVAIDLGVDLSTPHGKFLANVMASAAEWEREIIAQRTRDALAVKRAQGVRLGRPPLMLPEVRARIVEARKDGATLRQIADHLNAEGVPTAQGGTRWHPETVRKALRGSLSASKASDDVQDLYERPKS